MLTKQAGVPATSLQLALGNKVTREEMTFYHLWKNQSLHGDGDTEPAPGQWRVREGPAEEASRRKQAPAPHGKGATSSQEEAILPRTEHLARGDRDRCRVTAARGTQHVCVLEENHGTLMEWPHQKSVPEARHAPRMVMLTLGRRGEF